ncbi:MAG: hypothetical protein R3B09_17950 [Nannocystaceae bacterium]
MSERRSGRRSLVDRASTRILEALGTRLWGFAPRLMAVIVDELGGAAALSWFARNMPRYERTFKVFGPARTHLLASTISMLSGCKYCTFGHAYAFQLVVLRERNLLFPIDEGGFLELANADAVTVRARLTEALRAVRMDAEVKALDRLYELLDGAPPGDLEDQRIAHLIEMFATLNRCGIAGDVLPDAAHDPVNKDEALKLRYGELRRAQYGAE